MEEKEHIDLTIKQIFHVSKEVRKHLKVDEAGYRYVAGIGHKDAKSYLLYGALDESCMAVVALIQFRELLSETSGNTENEPGLTERIVWSYLVSDQQYWVRKLTETLVTLMCFSTTNEQGYYRHYLALTLLEERLGAQQDFKDFYGTPLPSRGGTD